MGQTRLVDDHRQMSNGAGAQYRAIIGLVAKNKTSLVFCGRGRPVSISRCSVIHGGFRSRQCRNRDHIANTGTIKKE
jgi:hypothetical protein